MTVATQSTASTSRSAQARTDPRGQYDGILGDEVEHTQRDEGAPSTRENGSRTSQTTRAPPNMFPRSFLSSLNPPIGAYTPHVDLLKRGVVLMTDTAVDYEEMHAKDGYRHEASTANSKKINGGAKAAMERSYTTSSTIHNMEDIAADYMALQEKHLAERRALEELQQKISQGLGAQFSDLVSEYRALLTRELQLLETHKKRKEDTKTEQAVKDFRQKVWEVHHPHDPLPSGKKNSGDADDDDGLEVVGAEESLRCPLTTLYLVNPQTSTICKHSYSKEALIAHLRSSRICPVQGCNKSLSMQDVQPNKALARRVARHLDIEKMEQTYDEFSYTTVE